MEREATLLEETPVDPPIPELKETPLQLLRYRVDRIEDAVGEMQSAVSLMDGSLRPLSLALIKIRLAVTELVIAADEHVE